MPLPRYVVLEHTGSESYKPGRHWDLMLEMGETLRCWELPQPPTAETVQTTIALADHRMAYLDYEGPVSNNRGRVVLWDSGNYELVSETPFELMASLTGDRVQGIVQLVRDRQDDNRWKFLLTRV